MEKNLFITITGTNFYYGMKPFEIDRVVRLVKEPDNEHDSEAIRAELPFIGKIGYVSNSPKTVARGTISAGHLYEQMGCFAYSQVLFVTTSKVICIVLTPEEVEGVPDDEKAQEENQEATPADSPEARHKFVKTKHPIGFTA